MASPPLFKYLDVNGAKLTLGNRTFRHAKPSSFEDLEDMTLRSIFPEEVEAALASLSDGCVDVVVANVNERPTCSPQSAAKISELQTIFRENPEVAGAVRDQIKELEIFDVEHMRLRSQEFLHDINEFLQ